MSETFSSPAPGREHKPDSNGNYFSEEAIYESQRLAAIDELHEAALNGYKGETPFRPSAEEQAQLDAQASVEAAKKADPFGLRELESTEASMAVQRQGRLHKAAGRVTGMFVRK